MLRRIQLVRDMAASNATDEVLGPPKPPTPAAKFNLSLQTTHAGFSRSSTNEFLRRQSPKAKQARSPAARSPRAQARAHFAAAASPSTSTSSSSPRAAGSPQRRAVGPRDERHPSVVDALDVAMSQVVS